jgi:O-antigen ligase
MILLLGITLIVLPRSPDGEGVKLERTSSIQARIQNWRNSLIIIRDHPIFGVGFNTYRYAQRAYGFTDTSKWLQSHAGAGADSSLLFVTATAGVFGLLAYLWYLRSLNQLRTPNSELQVVLVALLVHSLFLNSLFYPSVMLWLALLTAQGL